jgi:hypothetical protein
MTDRVNCGRKDSGAEGKEVTLEPLTERGAVIKAERGERVRAVYADLLKTQSQFVADHYDAFNIRV